MQYSLFLIESARANGNSLVHALLAKGYLLKHFDKIADACAQAERQPALVIIHAAAIKSSGMQIFRKARVHFKAPIILISSEGTRPLPDDPGYVHLLPPFTMRKLNNRIKRLLLPTESSMLTFGEIQLVPDRNQFMIKDQLISLTPITYKLLDTLVKKPGKLFSRAQLMREVWDTDYVGDTRTLDTHVSWLRKAMGESQDGRPYIETVRNEGYQFIEQLDLV